MTIGADAATTADSTATATATGAVASTTAAASDIGDFGSCTVPQIEFGTGFDNRKETSFQPVDQSTLFTNSNLIEWKLIMIAVFLSFVQPWFGSEH